MRRCSPVLTLALVLGLAGCTDGWTETGSPPTPSNPAPSNPSSSTSVSSSGGSVGSSSGASPASTPSPRPTVLPAAADGTDLGACRDGTCQILIRDRATVRLDRPAVAVTVERRGQVVVFTEDRGSAGGSTQLSIEPNADDTGNPTPDLPPRNVAYLPAGRRNLRFVVDALTDQGMVLSVRPD